MDYMENRPNDDTTEWLSSPPGSPDKGYDGGDAAQEEPSQVDDTGYPSPGGTDYDEGEATTEEGSTSGDSGYPPPIPSSNGR